MYYIPKTTVMKNKWIVINSQQINEEFTVSIHNSAINQESLRRRIKSRPCRRPYGTLVPIIHRTLPMKMKEKTENIKPPLFHRVSKKANGKSFRMRCCTSFFDKLNPREAILKIRSSNFKLNYMINEAQIAYYGPKKVK